METRELREQVALELDRMEEVVGELQKLVRDVDRREPTVRERTAGGAFLADFYMGVENIFKRISRYHGVDLPRSDRWHVELFQRFGPTSHESLPALLTDKLADELRPYRQFRHVVHHGYGFELDWNRMEEGIQRAPEVYGSFRRQVQAYLDDLQ